MRIVDLFSGAGGLTFGFYYNMVNNHFERNENCEIIFANEHDDYAAGAFTLNYPDVPLIVDDIRNVSEENIRRRIGQDEVDVIIGGPPCQSYSTIGKRVFDDKAKLYNEYLRLLSIIRPRMFLFENVIGMLSMKGEENELIIDEIQRRFNNIDDNFGYHIQYQVLDAVDYGVPQHRQRVFIIGIRNDENLNWNYPEPIRETYLSVADAISDLPNLTSGQTVTNYILPPQNSYQTLMRLNSDQITNHFSRIHGDKIQTIIEHVIPGEGKNYINDLVNNGVLDERYRLTSGYKNTYGRLVENQPCTTITNNMCTPSGLRCIHYQQNRALSPREGARIQSFPDWFQFSGYKKHIASQIGNAVPPLLAMCLARTIETAL